MRKNYSKHSAAYFARKCRSAVKAAELIQFLDSVQTSGAEQSIDQLREHEKALSQHPLSKQRKLFKQEP